MGRPTLDKKNTEFKMRMSETEKNKLKELFLYENCTNTKITSN